MNIAVIGTGYVGLVSGACFADFGHSVICVDTDRARLDTLRAGHVPFFEPGLAEIVGRNVQAGRLTFTEDTGAAVAASTVIFVAVGTPETPQGDADLTYLFRAAVEIGRHVRDYRLVVTKSTVPTGTGARLRQVLRDAAPPSASIEVASNPEFLREGSAVEDFMRPDRVVIGVGSARAEQILRNVYRPLYLIETPFVVTDVETAEMIKYAANAFLATKISFMNEIANLCEAVGADAHVVAKGMGLDRRIGAKFLHPGPGFGGSCFPKDTRALAATGRLCGVPQQIVETVIQVNEAQRARAVDKVESALGGLAGAEVAVLGLSFKPRTSDVRESPALHMCRALSAAGARVRAFDPVAIPEAARDLGPETSVRFVDGVRRAAEGADAIVIMTEWNEFRSIDLATLRPLMRRPVVLDLRNVLDPSAARAAGFLYVGTGRGSAVEVRA